jgi:hypothetical protein
MPCTECELPFTLLLLYETKSFITIPSTLESEYIIIIRIIMITLNFSLQLITWYEMPQSRNERKNFIELLKTNDEMNQAYECTEKCK